MMVRSPWTRFEATYRPVDAVLADPVGHGSTEWVRRQSRDPGSPPAKSSEVHRDVRLCAGCLDLKPLVTLEGDAGRRSQPEHRFADGGEVECPPPVSVVVHQSVLADEEINVVLGAEPRTGHHVLRQARDG